MRSLDESCPDRHHWRETSLGPYICDGHRHGNWAGLVGWATVYLIVITDALSIDRACVTDLYIVPMAGKLCAKCSVAKPHGQFIVSVPRGKVYVVIYVYDCYIHEGLPESG